MNPRFAYHAWRREAFNVSILKYRDFQGFIVSGQHSGTQWLKFMMGLAIARRYGLPEPQYINNEASNDILGHPKVPRKYPEAPRIAMSHSIPHLLFDSHLLRSVLSFPPFVLLVRDMRGVLVSHFEKWRTRYPETFSEFLRGDVTGKKHRADLWYNIRFYNRWGRVLERLPNDILLMRYENLRSDTLGELLRLRDHFALDIPDENFAYAAGEATKEKMVGRAGHAKLDEDRKVVRLDERDPLEWFSTEDLSFFKSSLRENLRYDLGYNFGLDEDLAKD